VYRISARRADFQESIMITFAQSSGNHSTSSGSWTPIPGLAVKLPGAIGSNALLILNVPNPYATGNNFPGGNFGIAVNGQIQSPFAAFTYNEQAPGSFGRIPTTLCVPLVLNSETPLAVEAMWNGIRGSTVNIDSPATLTAIVE
jgi:mannose-binding lectin